MTRVAAHTLDVTDVTCPLTWVRTKLALERLAPGDELTVTCKPGEALENVPRSAAEAGHEVGGRGHAGEDRPAVSEDRRAFFRAIVRSAAGRRARRRPRRAGLGDAEVERYSRQLVLPEWSEAAQLALREASVLVVGAGALGSPVAAYLAGAGVGRLGIVDFDDVEVSNLHRQTLHFTPDVGVAKAESAAAKLRFLNPEVVVEPYQARFAPAMLEGADLVVDCSDSFATRYEVNAACCAARHRRSSRAAWSASRGLVMAIRPGESACYRCAFPEPPPPGAAPSCAEAGVLGPAAGVIGSLQALEALKLLAGLDGALLDAFLQVDLYDHGFLRVAVSRRADCPDCAAHSVPVKRRRARGYADRGLSVRASIALTAGAAALFTLLVSVTSLIHFAYRNPALHVAVETAAALISIVAAQLIYGRFRQSYELARSPADRKLERLRGRQPPVLDHPGADRVGGERVRDLDRRSARGCSERRYGARGGRAEPQPRTIRHATPGGS